MQPIQLILVNFNSFITPESVPYKGEFIKVGQLSFYAQDEFLLSDQFSSNIRFTYGYAYVFYRPGR